MGYYSTFEFSIKDYGKDEKTTAKNVLEKMMEIMKTNQDFCYPITRELEYENLDEYDDRDDFEFSTAEAKWYDSDDDMKQLSKCFPKLLFKLHSVGEDGDTWDHYYKNGKSCGYQPIMPEFNEKDLK